jgi:hypothetical protein
VSSDDDDDFSVTGVFDLPKHPHNAVIITNPTGTVPKMDKRCVIAAAL